MPRDAHREYVPEISSRNEFCAFLLVLVMVKMEIVAFHKLHY